jgi:hypothetical protein
MKKMKDLLPCLREAKEQGKITYFVLDKLVVKACSTHVLNSTKYMISNLNLNG